MFRLVIKRSEEAAKELATALVDASQWFEFTPLPDGEYEFKVKNGIPAKFFEAKAESGN